MLALFTLHASLASAASVEGEGNVAEPQFDVTECFEKDVGYEVSSEEDVHEIWPVWNLSDCVDGCKKWGDECKFFTYDDTMWSCELKSAEGHKVAAEGKTSGPMKCDKGDEALKKSPKEVVKKLMKLSRPEVDVKTEEVEAQKPGKEEESSEVPNISPPVKNPIQAVWDLFFPETSTEAAQVEKKEDANCSKVKLEEKLWLGVWDATIDVTDTSPECMNGEACNVKCASEYSGAVGGEKITCNPTDGTVLAPTTMTCTYTPSCTSDENLMDEDICRDLKDDTCKFQDVVAGICQVALVKELNDKDQADLAAEDDGVVEGDDGLEMITPLVSSQPKRASGGAQSGVDSDFKDASAGSSNGPTAALGLCLLLYIALV